MNLLLLIFAFLIFALCGFIAGMHFSELCTGEAGAEFDRQHIDEELLEQEQLKRVKRALAMLRGIPDYELDKLTKMGDFLSKTDPRN